ncbi:hypothetical protein [Vampirovibrio sp.]|uniref:hypothetical protein n=1 Tax=Vampirovibrio sp. TaxID=2717857 RepID=UPI0035939194
MRNKQLASSLTTVAILSLSIPLGALADDPVQPRTDSSTTQSDSSTTQTDTTTQYGTTTTTTTQSSSTPSTTPGVSSLVLNNQFGYGQNEVIVGTADGTSPMVLPKLKIGSANTSIRVLNPTPNPVTFSVPQLNMTAVIPPNGARVVQIDQAQTASLTPGQEVAYYINDSEGNQIASSNFINEQEIVSMIDINTTIASSEESTTTSSTTAPPPTQRRSTVRGYW